MLVPDQNVEAGFSSQGDFRAIDTVNRRVASRRNMRCFDQTTGNHAHLHQPQAHIIG